MAITNVPTEHEEASQASDAALPAYRLDPGSVLKSLSSDLQQGLTTPEADRRLHHHGPNRLPEEPPLPAWRRFLAQFQNPLTILLLVATLVSFVSWLIERTEPIPFETLTILAIVLLNAVLGYAQEAQAEQAVAALKAMSAPHARVLRDARTQTIDAVNVVPGDILLLEEGDTLPADGRVLDSVALRLSEAALTGESTPVSKRTAAIDEEVGIGDRRNMVFSTTAVTAGRGRAVVTSTGAHTEIGKIAGTLQRTVQEETPLQRELDHVGRLLGIAVIVIAVIMCATLLFVTSDRSMTTFVAILLLAVSLAVAAVPEGLTAITTIVLSLGMQRMAQRNVIVRRLASVETLGSTTVICTDKTGTLTKNEMTVRALVTAHGRVDIGGTGYVPEGKVQREGTEVTDPALRYEVTRVLRVGSLASNARLSGGDGTWRINGDPTEGALVVAAHKIGLTTDELNRRFPRHAEVPFSSERKMMSTLHRDRERGDMWRLAVKGAPDVLLDHCTHELFGEEISPLTEARRNEIGRGVAQLADEALRTLGVASRSWPHDGPNHADESLETELVWLGAVGMIDPPRDEARDAVREAQGAGVRVIMITGDHPSTAAAIATELGIARPGTQAVTGRELEEADDTLLQDIVQRANVFARVAPEHKLRIVRALKAQGEIVAMTGDGVNDAPALKTADIGVAMGIAGTDVSKGASDMILTDDNFASIVAAVEEGRSIFSNIQKFLRFLLSSNIGEVLVMFLGVVLAEVIGLVTQGGGAIPVPLLATQILWINLLTDAGPALALGVEPPDHGVMQQPPRDPRTSVITPAMWWDIAFVGLIMGVGTLLLLDWSLPGGLLPSSGSLPYARTMTFTTLVLFQLFNVFNARFMHLSAAHHILKNKWLWLAVGVSLLLQIVVVYVPFMRSAFDTVQLSLMDWVICTLVGSSVLWLSEIKKLFMRARHRSTAARDPAHNAA